MSDTPSCRILEAREEDRAFWFSLDSHLSPARYSPLINENSAWILQIGQTPAGIMRWNLFWDEIPFLNLILLLPEYRRKGYGGMMMRAWEGEMKSRGFSLVMTSTQADEDAQHFYRRLGYHDIGGFVLSEPGFEQPMELMLCKHL